jgi:hypothetical protein
MRPLTRPGTRWRWPRRSCDGPGVGTPVTPSGGVLAPVESQADPLDAGGPIANSRGVSGTLGCFARSEALGVAVLVSSHHVLYGGDARDGESAWRPNHAGGLFRHEVARLMAGVFGVVAFEGRPVFVDVAVAALLPRVVPGGSIKGLFDEIAVAGCAPAVPGQTVRKIGATTDFTTGVVVDVSYPAVTPGGEVRPGQILIRPLGGYVDPIERTNVFADEGDSGAAVVDDLGRVVGVHWGSAPLGDATTAGVACPIGPALDALRIVIGAPPARPPG